MVFSLPSCPPHHEEGIFLPLVEFWSYTDRLIGKGSIETDRGLVGDACFEKEVLNLPLGTEVKIEFQKFFTPSPPPEPGMDSKNEKFGFFFHNPETDESNDTNVGPSFPLQRETIRKRIF